MVCEDDKRVAQQVMSPFAYRHGDGMKFLDIRGRTLKTRTKSLVVECDGVGVLEEDNSHCKLRSI